MFSKGRIKEREKMKNIINFIKTMSLAQKIVSGVAISTIIIVSTAVLLTRGNEKQIMVNDQQAMQAEEKSPLETIKNKLENKDFSDIAGTYKLVKFDNSWEKYNNCNIQSIIIDTAGGIHLNYPDKSATPIEEIKINTGYGHDYIFLDLGNSNYIGVYPAGFEDEDKGKSTKTPEAWYDTSKNRLFASFISIPSMTLYYMQVEE